MGSTVKWEKKIPFKEARNIRLPGAAALLEIFYEGGIFIEIDGELGVNSTYSQPISTFIHMSYDSNNQVCSVPTFRITRHKTECESVLEGSAAVTAGIYGKLGIAPLVKEIATIEAEAKLGVTFSSARDLSAGVTPIEILNTEMYDEINRDDFYRADLSVRGEISATLFGNTKLNADLEFGNLLFKNPIFQRGAVPRFENVSLTDADDPGTLSASATLGRKLMFGVPVGFALYDENSKFVDKWWADGEYKDNEGRTISHKFEGLKASTTYTLHPITSAFNDDMVANPSDDSKIEISLDTWDAMSIKSTSATLCGYVKGLSENDIYTCGFYYGTEPTVGPENGTYVESTEIADGMFTANIDNLQSKTPYFYKACVTLNGKTIFAETTKQFKTFSTAQITGRMELISFSATNATWDESRWYEGVYMVTFDNLEDRKILIKGHVPGYDNGEISVVDDERYASLSFSTGFIYYSSDYKAWINPSRMEFDSNYNSALIYIIDKGEKIPWENKPSKWVATISKPCGLKFPYIDNIGERGEVIIDFNITYNQKPKFSNFILDNNQDYARVRFDISGLHWIREVKVTDHIISLEDGSTYFSYTYNLAKLGDSSRTFLGDGEYNYISIEPCFDYNTAEPIQGIGKSIIQCILLDGKIYSVELNYAVYGFSVSNLSWREVSE